MKKIIILLLLTFSTWVCSEETTKYQIELSSSLYTMHYSDKIADKYKNKVSDDGRLIDNPIYGITLNWAKGRDYQSVSLFQGKDSINSDMAGFAYSIGKKNAYNSGFNIGFVTGIYFYDEDAWSQRYVERNKNGDYTTKSPSWVRTYIDDDLKGFNIILGAEVNYQFNLSKDFFIKSKNIVTPQIINTSIVFGANF